MLRFRLLKAPAAAATLIALSAAVPAMAADVVKIGILWPLTGNAAAAGQASGDVRAAITIFRGP